MGGLVPWTVMPVLLQQVTEAGVAVEAHQAMIATLLSHSLVEFVSLQVADPVL